MIDGDVRTALNGRAKNRSPDWDPRVTDLMKECKIGMHMATQLWHLGPTQSGSGAPHSRHLLGLSTGETSACDRKRSKRVYISPRKHRYLGGSKSGTKKKK